MIHQTFEGLYDSSTICILFIFEKEIATIRALFSKITVTVGDRSIKNIH